MGFGFRKSIKIAPGLKLNISHRGIGVSAGVKGARVSVNSNGKVRATVSKNGLSYTKNATLKK